MEQIYSPTKIWNRWSKEFGTLFSSGHLAQGKDLNQSKCKPVKIRIQKSRPLPEIKKICKQMKKGKVASIDGNPLEIWKYRNHALQSKFYEILICKWERKKLQEFNDTKEETITESPSSKITWEIFPWILWNKLVSAVTERNVPESRIDFQGSCQQILFHFYIHTRTHTHTHTHTHIYIYIYIYVCVCVCVCVWKMDLASQVQLLNKVSLRFPLMQLRKLWFDNLPRDG